MHYQNPGADKQNPDNPKNLINPGSDKKIICTSKFAHLKSAHLHI
jgi:hypothetical protein